jgi:hypothetical protein
VLEVVADVARFEPTLSLRSEDRVAPLVATSEQTRGPGAWFTRTREREVSRFEIAEVAPDHVLYSVSAGDTPSRFRIELEATGDATEVTYAIEGELDTFPKRALWPIADLDGRVGPELEQSLEHLEHALPR